MSCLNSGSRVVSPAVSTWIAKKELNVKDSPENPVFDEFRSQKKMPQNHNFRAAA